MKRDLYFYFLMFVSLFSLSLLGKFVLSPPIKPDPFLWRKLIICSTYTLICVLGIVAAFFPKVCSTFLHWDIRTRNSNTIQNIPKKNSFVSKLRITHGHHPMCGKFTDHEFEIKNKTFCIGCVGLSFGALASLIGVFLYFLDVLIIIDGVLIVFIGLVGVMFGLILLLIIRIRGLIRLFLNSSFVLGTFFILIGFDSLIQSMVFDFFLLMLIIFWLWTRISISKWDHIRICRVCGFKCFKPNDRIKINN